VDWGGEVVDDDLNATEGQGEVEVVVQERDGVTKGGKWVRQERMWSEVKNAPKTPMYEQTMTTIGAAV
jgi:hypothetical protein